MRKITGKITDRLGDTIPFASVTVTDRVGNNIYYDGSPIGVVSDDNGSFELEVPESETKQFLTAKSSGLKQQTLPVDDGVVEFVMGSNIQDVGEVTVSAKDSMKNNPGNYSKKCITESCKKKRLKKVLIIASAGVALVIAGVIIYKVYTAKTPAKKLLAA